ncbi:hypothetical protein EXN66_Car021021 [Channa argus]|uniref:Uncharacterized protein n=1 Tax=Channa argus TaxID=215402 RepID=A0A6G1QRH9_CHAAH|nr:hypothetical protein EXN66_Car021021 [Channa argus]
MIVEVVEIKDFGKFVIIMVNNDVMQTLKAKVLIPSSSQNSVKQGNLKLSCSVCLTDSHI